MNKKAFTLVELIVVITILAILATVGFVSFSWYLAWTRDTNRKAQLKSMGDALELYRTKKDLPIPDDKVDIKIWTGSTEKVIAYQGYIWKNVLETIEYTESWLDPKNKQYFSYYLTKNKKYFQLMAFLEEESDDIVEWANAEDYSERHIFTKWKKLWILTAEDKTPIQEVAEIKDSWAVNLEYTTEVLVANVDSQTPYTELNQIASVAQLWWIKSSCKNYLDANPSLSSKDWFYMLFWKDGQIFPTYCDMTTDWGGWTLLLKADWTKTTFYYNNSIWEDDSVLNEYSTNLTGIEYKSRLFSNMKFTEINLVLDTAWTIKNQKLDFVSNSLKETFNSGEQEFPVTKAQWLALVPWSSMQPYCNKWWLNVSTNVWKARMWFTSNNETSCTSNDSYIWIWIAPRNSYNASVWNNCGSSLCSNWNISIKSLWYIYVR